MLSLNLLATQAHRSDLADQARRARVNATATPVTRVTLRYAAAADAPRLRDLAELDSAPLPDGLVLLAEVDGRLDSAWRAHSLRSARARRSRSASASGA